MRKTLLAAAILLALSAPAQAGLSFFTTCTDSQGWNATTQSSHWPGSVQVPSDLCITGLCPTKDESYDPERHKQIIFIRDNENARFNFESFQTYSGGLIVSSNRGGYFTTDYTQEPNLNNDPWWELDPFARQDPTYNMNGEGWEDLSWVHIDYGQYGPGDYEQFHLANFAFRMLPYCNLPYPACSPPPAQVPEPGTLGSLLVGVAGLYVFRRHRQWQRKQPNRPTMM